ncbi:copper-binding protein [Basilea psittacipulmonis]|uniref:Copper-binding protein n=1 Tax=Basilea psittacipulmonis DSM 24701 TaxID=1072685 RepID=A0A077DE90_9BURK|nr:copper-binding protein [Basilea psittacipulmonis]AIL33014.1 hypothetical protein IX83_06530 [Basilea psittacipulmonis DSM 24701]
MKKFLLTLSALVLSTSVMAATATGSGQVRRVDNGKIIIKQSAITSLNIPAGSFAYHITPSLASKVAAGDEVNFTVEVKNNEYYITQINK